MSARDGARKEFDGAFGGRGGGGVIEVDRGGGSEIEEIGTARVGNGEYPQSWQVLFGVLPPRFISVQRGQRRDSHVWQTRDPTGSKTVQTGHGSTLIVFIGSVLREALSAVGCLFILCGEVCCTENK
jgi:hypothetical protein